ncbi:MAG: ROK family protein [bacterium]
MPSSRHAVSVAIGVDLGGTDLKCGAVNATGRVMHSQRFPSDSKKGKQAVVRRLLSAIAAEEAWAKESGYQVVGVGLGVPGILSHATGIVHRSPHFPDWKDFALRSLLKKRLRFPFVLDNDANMAALGEGWRGRGKGRRNFILLTLGTGIGGGIVLDGNIFHGDSGFAGELGHLVIERNGRPCNCGGRGCLEMYASATGIQYDLRSPSLRRRGPGGGQTAESLYHLALRGNKTAKKIFENFGQALGAGVASLANILDVEHFILGGGLSAAWKAFAPSVKKAIAQHTYPTTAKKIRLERAQLGNQAGLIGAARAAFLTSATKRSASRVGKGIR